MTTPHDADDSPLLAEQTPLHEQVRSALGTLVDLKDGPRDEFYELRKIAAWQRARKVLAVEREDWHNRVVKPLYDAAEQTPTEPVAWRIEWFSGASMLTSNPNEVTKIHNRYNPSPKITPLYERRTP